jgi:hypothetical protein
MDESNIYEKPNETVGDAAHTLARAGLSMIPLIGGPAVELLSTILTPPIERRRDEWIESIATGLQMLAEKVDGFNIDDLSQNEIFVTTVLHASQVALRSHQREKLRALRNAVLNTAIRNATDEDLQLIFLRYIDMFTPLHMRILHLFDDIQAVARTSGIVILHLETDNISSNYYDLLEYIFPELKDKKALCKHIGEDLYSNGLLTLNNIQAPLPERFVYYSYTSLLGKQFLSFITSPIKDDE